MTDEHGLTRANLRTPKAAAIAGILFCILFMAVLWLLRMSVPTDPLEAGEWLRTSSGRVALALNLVPFAGLAFLWFIGVLRDRLGTREDRFFATVFLGSGLLFIAMLFCAAAVVGGILAAFAIDHDGFVDSATFHFARSAGLQHHQCLCGQSGGRVPNLDLNARVLHRHGATLDGAGWVLIGGVSVVRRKLCSLDHCRFPALDSPDQCSHPT